MKHTTFIAALLAAAFATSCATMQLPQDDYKPGETVAAATERGAEDNPEARKYLQSAKKKIAKADELRGEGEEDAARLELMEAQADADYALALLRRDDAKAEAKEIRRKVRSLEADMDELDGSQQ
jgi:hypothetical protein